MNEHPTPDVPIPHSWWVEPGRFLAGPYPGSPDADVTAERIHALLDTGVRCLINLQEPTETGNGAGRFPDYTPVVTAWASEHGVDVVCHRFSIPDQEVPTTELLRTILQALDDGLRDGVVYVHCWGGHGRTGTVAGCWLRERGLDGDAAVQHMARARRHDSHLTNRNAPETCDQRSMIKRWSSEQAS